MTNGSQENFLTGTLLDGLAGTLSLGVESLADAESKLDDLTSTRDEELERIRRSYNEDITAAQRGVSEVARGLGADRVDLLLHESLDSPIEAASLDIALRRRDYTVPKFSDALVAALKGDEREKQAVTRLIAPLLGVSSLLKALQEDNGSTLVAAIHLGWQQQYDAQAEHEGRPSATGVYEKECNILIGRIGESAIDVVAKPVDTTSFVIPERPQAVELIFPKGVQIITSEQEWGYVQSAVSVTQRQERVSLVSDSPSEGRRFEYLSGQDVDWLLSEQLDFSLAETTPINRNLRRSNPKTLLVYGDNVLRSINALREDKDVPTVTKTALEQIDL